MNPLIVFVIVAIIGAIIFLSHNTESPEEAREKFLQKLAGYFESKVTVLEGEESVTVISFVSGGRDFIYEDIEDKTIEQDVYRQAFLKTQADSKLSLAFTEKNRSTIRANITNIENLKNGWAQEAGIVPPPSLAAFGLHANHAHMAQELMRDPRIEKIFSHYKNRGTRGDPIMSIEIKSGLIRLKFHPPGELVPNINTLQQNLSSIDGHLDAMLALAEILEAVQVKQDQQQASA